MRVFLASALVIILTIGTFLLAKDFYVKFKLRKVVLKKYEVVEPLMRKLAAQEHITNAEIQWVADFPSYRVGLYRLLQEYDRANLFPSEYMTTEKGAESFLANWLEFPTELGKAPDEIEFLEKVLMGVEEELTYYVFKYKTYAPHWAASRQWMLGVSGPYVKDSLAYDVPVRVFSRFNALGTLSPSAEVKWVHEHIGN